MTKQELRRKQFEIIAAMFANADTIEVVPAKPECQIMNNKTEILSARGKKVNLNAVLSSIEETMTAITDAQCEALDANNLPTYEQLRVVYSQVEDTWVRVRDLQKGTK